MRAISDVYSLVRLPPSGQQSSADLLTESQSLVKSNASIDPLAWSGLIERSRQFGSSVTHEVLAKGIQACHMRPPASSTWLAQMVEAAGDSPYTRCEMLAGALYALTKSGEAMHEWCPAVCSAISELPGPERACCTATLLDILTEQHAFYGSTSRTAIRAIKPLFSADGPVPDLAGANFPNVRPGSFKPFHANLALALEILDVQRIDGWADVLTAASEHGQGSLELIAQTTHSAYMFTHVDGAEAKWDALAACISALSNRGSAEAVKLLDIASRSNFPASAADAMKNAGLSLLAQEWNAPPSPKCVTAVTAILANTPSASGDDWKKLIAAAKACGEADCLVEICASLGTARIKDESVWKALIASGAPLVDVAGAMSEARYRDPGSWSLLIDTAFNPANPDPEPVELFVGICGKFNGITDLNLLDKLFAVTENLLKNDTVAGDNETEDSNKVSDSDSDSGEDSDLANRLYAALAPCIVHGGASNSRLATLLLDRMAPITEVAPAEAQRQRERIEPAALLNLWTALCARPGPGEHAQRLLRKLLESSDGTSIEWGRIPECVAHRRAVRAKAPRLNWDALERAGAFAPRRFTTFPQLDEATDALLAALKELQPAARDPKRAEAAKDIDKLLAASRPDSAEVPRATREVVRQLTKPGGKLKHEMLRRLQSLVTAAARNKNPGVVMAAAKASAAMDQICALADQAGFAQKLENFRVYSLKVLDKNRLSTLCSGNEVGCCMASDDQNFKHMLNRMASPSWVMVGAIAEGASAKDDHLACVAWTAVCNDARDKKAKLVVDFRDAKSSHTQPGKEGKPNEVGVQVTSALDAYVGELGVQAKTAGCWLAPQDYGRMEDFPQFKRDLFVTQLDADVVGPPLIGKTHYTDSVGKYGARYRPAIAN